MNKDRRKELEKALGLLSEAREILEAAKDEEQEYFDNMPEGLQSGEKGEKAENAISEIEEAISSIESAEENINTASE